MTKAVCKDCAPGSARPAPFPGPRCATHHRVKRNAGRVSAWAARLLRNFGLTAEEYDRIKAAQGGTCYVCGTVRGVTKRLAVEHNHTTGLLRGLSCGPCNWLLAKWGDDPARLRAVADALENPPATAALGGPRYVPSMRTISTDDDLEG